MGWVGAGGAELNLSGTYEVFFLCGNAPLARFHMGRGGGRLSMSYQPALGHQPPSCCGVGPVAHGQAQGPGGESF
jgi:hypothetical protein